jgi:hypothetical protein
MRKRFLVVEHRAETITVARGMIGVMRAILIILADPI